MKRIDMYVSRVEKHDKCHLRNLAHVPRSRGCVGRVKGGRVLLGVMTCAFYFKIFTLIPFLLHYYHVTFRHVTPHMTHSIRLPITWSPPHSFSHMTHCFPRESYLYLYAFPHESLWLWWLYVSPTISDSQWFPMNHSIVYWWLCWEYRSLWLVTTILRTYY